MEYDNYSIKEENGNYILRDGDLKLSKHPTEGEARTELSAWCNRDELELKIEDFYTEMQAQYGFVLEADEISQMIKAH
ncbi:hypothetical protein LCGC14_1858010 [marine sediment metagenome]|uniref:Uncharacterized protein n=1 Tax=marine sediment metagenome TaxID=412755 RepID=A0A0F9IMR5_9ZZZZ